MCNEHKNSTFMTPTMSHHVTLQYSEKKHNVQFKIKFGKRRRTTKQARDKPNKIIT